MTDTHVCEIYFDDSVLWLIIKFIGKRSRLMTFIRSAALIAFMWKRLGKSWSFLAKCVAQSAVQLIYNCISRSQYSTYALLFQTLSNWKENSDFTARVWHSNVQHFKWIRIRGFDDKKLQKRRAEKFFILFFQSKIAIYLSLGLLKGRQSYRRSLKPQNSTSGTQKIKIY
jgi:hypothetical protein